MAKSFMLIKKEISLTVKYLDGIEVLLNYGEKAKVTSAIQTTIDTYYDKETGAFVNRKILRIQNNWYYANSKGNILTGKQVIDGKHVYFTMRITTT